MREYGSVAILYGGGSDSDDDDDGSVAVSRDLQQREAHIQI